MCVKDGEHTCDQIKNAVKDLVVGLVEPCLDTQDVKRRDLASDSKVMVSSLTFLDVEMRLVVPETKVCILVVAYEPEIRTLVILICTSVGADDLNSEEQGRD